MVIQSPNRSLPRYDNAIRIVTSVVATPIIRAKTDAIAVYAAFRCRLLAR
jgi:hypothetical protein